LLGIYHEEGREIKAWWGGLGGKICFFECRSDL
jgi:hypothetical protein